MQPTKSQNAGAAVAALHPLEPASLPSVPASAPARFRLFRRWGGLPALAVLAAALLWSLPGQAADLPDQINLGRDEAVAMAIRKNIDLRVEALNTNLAETSLAKSRGFYDPFLTASVTGGRNTYPGETFRTRSTYGSLAVTQYLSTGGSIAASAQSGYTTAFPNTPGVPTNDWQSAVGLTLSQPLLKNSGRKTTELSITLAENALQGTLERFRFTLTDTVFAVITAYNRLYTLRQVLEFRNTALTSVQALREDLARKPRPGPLQKVEIANADYAISQRRKELVDADRNVRDQEAHLRYLLGIEGKTSLNPVDPPSREEPPESEGEAVKAALAFRPDLQQLRLELQASELQERVARHQRLPDLAASASGGFSGIGGDIGNSFQQIGDGEGVWWSASLALSVPLGNTTAANEYRLNKIRTEQVKHRLTAYAWQVQNAVEADLRALISARLQLQTTEQSLRSAEQRVAEYRKHTKGGSSSVQDVLSAENDLTAARNSQLDAIEGFAYAVALLWRDTGLLLDHQRIRVDQPPPAPPAPTNPGADVTPPPAPLQPAAGGGPFSLWIGEFATGEELAAARAKLAGAGVAAVATPGPGRTEPVTRLLLAALPDRKAANRELKRLRQAGADPFVIEEDARRCFVYAGSFRSAAAAAREQRRLVARGIDLTLHPASVPVKTTILTAGPFPTRDAAEAAAGRIEGEGLLPVVINGAGSGAVLPEILADSTALIRRAP